MPKSKCKILELESEISYLRNEIRNLKSKHKQELQELKEEITRRLNIIGSKYTKKILNEEFDKVIKNARNVRE